jgi:hypothetical protein
MAITNKMANAQREQSCFAVTAERKYYYVDQTKANGSKTKGSKGVIDLSPRALLFATDSSALHLHDIGAPPPNPRQERLQHQRRRALVLVPFGDGDGKKVGGGGGDARGS